jgi:hypothetical protein
MMTAILLPINYFGKKIQFTPKRKVSEGEKSLDDVLKAS